MLDFDTNCHMLMYSSQPFCILGSRSPMTYTPANMKQRLKDKVPKTQCAVEFVAATSCSSVEGSTSQQVREDGTIGATPQTVFRALVE